MRLERSLGRAAAAGLLAASIFSPDISVLPLKSANAQTGCGSPEIVGPFQAGRSPEPPTQIALEENQVLQLEVWDPRKGLGDKPVQTVISGELVNMPNSRIIVSVSNESAGIAWKYINCPWENVVAIMDQGLQRSGESYIEPGDLQGRGVIKIEAQAGSEDMTSGNIPETVATSTDNQTESGEMDCNSQVIGPFPAGRAGETLLNTGDNISVIEVWDSQNRIGDKPVRSILDRQNITVSVGGNVAATQYFYPLSCSLSGVMSTLDENVSLVELSELVAKGVVKIIPRNNQAQ